MAVSYPDDLSKILGITEATNGIGVVGNSVLGSFIHKTFGFKATFLWNSFLYVSIGFFTIMMLPSSLNITESGTKDEKENEDDGLQVEDLGYFFILSHKDVLFALMA